MAAQQLITDHTVVSNSFLKTSKGIPPACLFFVLWELFFIKENPILAA